jgi:hypothetical protein
MADDKEETFKITDRRMFNPDGTLRGEEPEEVKPKKQKRPEEAAHETADNVVSFPGGGQEAPDWSQYGSSPDFPAPTFSGFMNMLGVEAAMHLGLIENPMGGGPTVDIEAARHLIDTIAMLQEKTTGNLTAEETALLESMLSELRMQFVMASRKR